MEGWRLTAFEVLERLSHVYHMSEIWVAAGQKYKMVITCMHKDFSECICWHSTVALVIIGQYNLMQNNGKWSFHANFGVITISFF